MKQGRDLEGYVAKRFTEATGLKVRRSNAMYIHKGHNFMLADVDRLIIGENAGLECKTANVLSLKRYRDGEYPPEYYCQCQHYMAVTGAAKWYLAVLVFGTEFLIFEIKRDEEDIAALMKEEKTFWYENVMLHEMPAPCGTDQNGAVLDAMYPRDNGAEIELVGYDAVLRRYFEICGMEKKLGEEKAKIQQEIKSYMGEAEKASSDRYKVSWATSLRRSAASVKELEAAGLTEFIKETQTRRFIIKERT